MPVDPGVDPSKIITLLKSTHLFRGLNDNQLAKIAGLCKQEWYEQGATILKQNDRDSRLFLIVSGRVKVVRIPPGSHSEVLIGYLEEPGYFGLEALEYRSPRKVSVITVRETTVIYFDQKALNQIQDEFGFVSRRLKMVLDSYNLSFDVSFNWLSPDETLFYISRKHPVFLIGSVGVPLLLGLLITLPLVYIYLYVFTTVLLLIIAGFIGAATIVAAGYNYIDWSNDYYMITSRRVVFQEKIMLLYDSRQEYPLEAIQSMSVTTDFLGRQLSYGNITIRSYIGSLVFQGISNPDYIITMINEQKIRAQSISRKNEFESMKQFARKRKNPPPVQPQSASKSASGDNRRRKNSLSLANLLHLRYEQAGSVVFRTHWFILLTHTWWQILLLVGMLAALIARVFGLYSFISIPSLAALLFVAGLGVGSVLLYNFIDWNNDLFIISSDQIIDINRKPLGMEERRTAPIKGILSIEFERIGLVGLFLNFGTVNIRTGGSVLTLEYVYNPSDVQREIFERMQQLTLREKIMQAEGEWQRMADMIEADQIVRNELNQSPPPPAN
ncbi:MAG TPA: cyclic nucleotide-binding domain-containing protein [Anaerolineaceae bacterium]